MTKKPTIRLNQISKTFGGQRALSDVCLTINPGEIHGLLGHNGSGKSTLIKILAGFHEPDKGGSLEMYGDSVKLPLNVGDFKKLGMSFVHQDLGLIESISALENLFLNKFAGEQKWRISWREEYNRALEVFMRFELDIDPFQAVSKLTPVQRALLAIVRAVEEINPHQQKKTKGRGLLILDEPTVFLPRHGVEQLFKLIREISKLGVSVLFVSHDLDEVMEITDSLTILRNGKVQICQNTSEITKEKLIKTITGGGIRTFERNDLNREASGVNITFQNISGKTVNDVSLEINKGEVLGLTGILGSGFEEVPYLIYGDQVARDGKMRLNDQTFDLANITPKEAIKCGIILVPADRHNAGGVETLSVVDNYTMPIIGHYFMNGLLNRKSMSAKTATMIKDYQVYPDNSSLKLQALSGGNQQKVILAKWFQTNPSLAILHEPTQGIDIGARAQIFEIIKGLTEKGTSVLCCSSDYDQLSLICDRVLIFAKGRIVSQLSGEEISKDAITERCYNSLEYYKEMYS